MLHPRKTNSEIDDLVTAGHAGLTSGRCADIGGTVKNCREDFLDSLWDLFQTDENEDEVDFFESLFQEGAPVSTLQTVGAGDAVRTTSIDLTDVEIKAALAGGASGNVPAFTLPPRSVLLGYLMRIVSCGAGGAVSSVMLNLRHGETDWSDPREALDPVAPINFHVFDSPGTLPYYLVDDAAFYTDPTPVVLHVAITGGVATALQTTFVHLAVLYAVLP